MKPKSYSTLFSNADYPVLITSPQNIFYITGFYTTAKKNAQIGVTCLLMTPRSTYFLIPSNWSSYVEDFVKTNKISDLFLIPYTKGISGMVTQLLSLLPDSFPNHKTIGFEKDAMELEFYLELTIQLKRLASKIQWEDISFIMKQLRKKKSPEEIQALKASAKVASSAMEDIKHKIRPGITELELVADLEYSMRKNGSDGVPFTAKVLAGENAVRTVNLPGKRIIHKQDMVLLDFGAVINGYASDWTRTFAVQQACQKQVELYKLVWEIERTCIALIRPGITFSQLFEHAYKILDGHPFAQWFHPYLGHSIGICSQEYPLILPDSSEILEKNMVITIEPGIYVPELGGVRIEDEVLVTSEGHEILTGLKKEEFII